ncbi:hypothetical protein, partial [Cronobacter sakazakii]|uniref:hypothetical protein n=1 Tax=Cronobacter sakazakii TaxID=28141 RepID=UPI003F79186A
ILNNRPPSSLAGDFIGFTELVRYWSVIFEERAITIGFKVVKKISIRDKLKMTPDLTAKTPVSWSSPG